MPTTCCAPGCTQRHSKSSDVRFFRLPKDEERRKKWIISMKRMQADTPNRLWEPSYHDRICSLHFISGSTAAAEASEALRRQNSPAAEAGMRQVIPTVSKGLRQRGGR
uniref:THAP domain-containing protein 1 n=1 Tax=Fundulus heteroclitus TaxID=8078 RepID=A0A3Q2NX31_FUNHE